MTRRTIFFIVTFSAFIMIGALLVALNYYLKGPYQSEGIVLLYVVIMFGPYLGVLLEWDNNHPDEMP